MTQPKVVKHQKVLGVLLLLINIYFLTNGNRTDFIFKFIKTEFIGI